MTDSTLPVVANPVVIEMEPEEDANQDATNEDATNGKGGPGKKRKYVRRKTTAPMVTEEKLQEMFTTYCNTPNYSYVARVSGCHVNTVRKYAKDQDWEERRQKILATAREKADYTVEKASEQSLLMLRHLKKKIAEKIQNLNAQSLSTDSLVKDFETLVKLEQVLMGGVSDRQETQMTTHEERVEKLMKERKQALT